VLALHRHSSRNKESLFPSFSGNNGGFCARHGSASARQLPPCSRFYTVNGRR